MRIWHLLILSLAVSVFYLAGAYAGETKPAPPANSTPATHEGSKQTEQKTAANQPEDKVKTPEKPENNGKLSRPFGPGITKRKNDSNIRQLDKTNWTLQYFLVMLMLAGLFTALWVGLKLLNRRLSGHGYGSMEVIQRLALDGKNSVVLMRWHDDELLLGVGPQGVQLLDRAARLDDIDEERESQFPGSEATENTPENDAPDSQSEHGTGNTSRKKDGPPAPFVPEKRTK